MTVGRENPFPLAFCPSNLTQTCPGSKSVLRGDRAEINHLGHRMDSEGRTKGKNYIKKTSIPTSQRVKFVFITKNNLTMLK